MVFLFTSTLPCEPLVIVAESLTRALDFAAGHMAELGLDLRAARDFQVLEIATDRPGVHSTLPESFPCDLDSFSDELSAGRAN